jgi:TonB family protein
MAAALLIATCISTRAQAPDDVIRPSVIYSPIQYPASAVSAREEGTTSVDALVEADGRVSRTMLDKSSGHASLDNAALQSVSRWRFSPRKRNGKAEAWWVRLPVSFHLQVLPDEAVAPKRDWSGMASTAAGLLGLAIWLVGFGWSVVLAKRRSILWSSGMVALWAITYPLFVATHWSLAKRNLAVVIVGLALLAVSLYLAHPYRPSA